METKNDRRSRKTQKLIFDTFTGLLHKKDFAKISIKDITDQADVNRSTFYIHFEDKYDLLNKYLAFQTLDFSSYAVQIHANIPQEKIQELMTLIFSYFDSKHELFEILFNNENEKYFLPPFQVKIKQILDDTLSWTNKDVLYQQVDLIFISSALASAIKWWLQNPDSLSIQQIASHVTELFARFTEKPH